MGEALTAESTPPLEILAVGTSPVARIEVIRNEEVVYST